MSILPLLASLLGTDEAEAKQFFASERGELKSDIPLKFDKQTLKDVLGKEPESQKEFKVLIDKKFNQMKKDFPQLTTGELINLLNNDLLEASVGALHPKDIKEVVPKVLTSLGIPEKEQEKYNQVWIQSPDQYQKGVTYATAPKDDTAPLGTGYEEIVSPQSELNLGKMDFVSHGLPITNKIPARIEKNKTYIDKEKIWPFTRAYLTKERPEKSAALMAHELIHAISKTKTPEKKFTEEDKNKILKNANLNTALKKLGFMEHFPQESGEYGLHYAVAKMTHPEWFKSDVKPSPSPSPTPIEMHDAPVTEPRFPYSDVDVISPSPTPIEMYDAPVFEEEYQNNADVPVKSSPYFDPQKEIREVFKRTKSKTKTK
jgi:hypothetical protein